MSNEPNLDRNWGFDVNLSGLQAPTGQSSIEIPEGYYKAVVSDMYVNADNNAGRVIIKLSIVESAFAGALRTTGLNIPKSAEDNVRYYWRGMAESAGYSPAQLDAGQITIGVQAFKGKTVYIKFVPKEEGNPSRAYENISFLPPADWSQQKQGFDAMAATQSVTQQAAPAGSALGGSASATANALGSVVPAAQANALGPAAAAPANNTVSQNDVLAKLGLGGGAANA